MNYFNALLPIIITLFLLMICGYFCRKWGIIDGTASKNLSRLIISVGQPMMIIAPLFTAEFTKENLKIALTVTLISFVLHIVTALVAFLICRRMKNLNRAKIFEFTLIFANCGFLGFPILDALYGGELNGGFMGAFYVISFHLFLWTWGIFILGKGREDIKLTPKKILVNYGTIPCAIGVACYFLKPLVGLLPAAVLEPLSNFALEPLAKFMTYLGNLCTPISVLITGGLLATISLRAMFKDRLLYLHSFLKLIVFPLVACVVTKLLGLSETYIMLCTVMAGLPSAATVCMLAELYDIEPGYASQTVGMTSLLTTLSLPCVVLFAQWVITL